VRDYPKHIKRLVRTWLGQAYDRELQRELAKLDQSFAGWRSGQIDSAELSDRIHRFEVGPARELYKRYNQGDEDMTLAYVIVAGVLAREEVPAELLQALERPLSFYQSWKDRDDLRAPDDFSRR
jgi:hypothetical protein